MIEYQKKGQNVPKKPNPKPNDKQQGNIGMPKDAKNDWNVLLKKQTKQKKTLLFTRS